jgi:hypothetical protein
VSGARRWMAAPLTGLLVALLAAPARADDDAGKPPESPEQLPVRAASVGLDKTSVLIGLTYRDALDAKAVARLQSGLPTVIAMRGYLFREGEKVPVALTAKTCRVVYDLWEEVFRLQILQPGRSGESTALNVEGVLRQCTEAQRLHLIERPLMREGARHFVATIVEVNPMSPETLETIRRWVTRPSKSTAIGPGDSLFGSFVGLFVTRVGAAERRIAFRSGSFLPPRPPPPPPPPKPRSGGGPGPRGRESA